MLILLIALPLLTGLAAALPFPSRRGRLTFLLTMQIIETALVSGRWCPAAAMPPTSGT